MRDIELAIDRKSPLAKAFLEDEAQRFASQKRARKYLIEKEEEESKTSVATWCALFFMLGMLTALTIPYTIPEIIMSLGLI